MQILIKSFFLAFLSLSFSYAGPIIERDNFRQIDKEISKAIEDYDGRVFAIFDLDNTTLAPEAYLASDQFLEWQANLLKENIKQYRIADNYDDLLRINDSFHFYAKKRLTDQYIKEMMEKWKAKGMKIAALTARDKVLRSLTMRDNKKLGIDFSNSIFNNTDYFRGKIEGFSRTILIDSGIMYLSGQDKGIALNYFMKKFNKSADLVIFIDDKLKYIDQVQEAMDANGIKFIGYRFTGEDKKVSPFITGKASSLNREKRIALREFAEFKKNNLCNTYVVPFRE